MIEDLREALIQIHTFSNCSISTDAFLAHLSQKSGSSKSMSCLDLSDTKLAYKKKKKNQYRGQGKQTVVNQTRIKLKTPLSGAYLDKKNVDQKVTF